MGTTSSCAFTDSALRVMFCVLLAVTVALNSIKPCDGLRQKAGESCSI